MKSSIFIYLDGFRGFSKTVFELKQVNFLVGENSTGKTSVLALLNVILSPNFWLQQRFNTEAYDFGGLRDILSAHLPATSEFTVGVFLADEQKTGFMASFRDHEGLPVCSFFARFDGKHINAIRKNDQDIGQVCKLATSFDFLAANPEESFRVIGDLKNNPETAYKDLDGYLAAGIGLLPLWLLAGGMKAENGNSNLPLSGFNLPRWAENIVWLASIRTRPHRTYDGYPKYFSPEGEHTPFILRKVLESKQAKAFATSLNTFGKASGLFKKVGVKQLGRGAADPFEILITLSAKALRIDSVGYGISQVLPLLVEILIRPPGTWFAIQQPEVHLHPKAQAALGDLIFQVAQNENKRFLIETHSDFTIDRFRLNFRQLENPPIAAQILFFERQGEGNQVTMIPIVKNGEFSEQQPANFRDFFLKEQLSILGI